MGIEMFQILVPTILTTPAVISSPQKVKKKGA